MNNKKAQRDMVGAIYLIHAVAASLLICSGWAAAADSGQLLLSRQVTINGKEAVSGQTIFDGNRIKVGEKGVAVVGLGKQGRLELGGNSEMTLLVSGNNIGGMFATGCLTISVASDGNVMLELPAGIISSSSKQSSFFSVQATGGVALISSDLGSIKVTADGKSEIVGSGESVVLKNEVSDGVSLKRISKKEIVEERRDCSCDCVSASYVFTQAESKKVSDIFGLLHDAWIATKTLLLGLKEGGPEGTPRANGSGLTCVNTDGIFCKPAGPVTP
ncbi:MAG TPA: hypothetical protein PLD20_00575 [Blastocatellia bacterium]|nr:hypothetical protein [Blastocatellia bacterium]HMX24197.1 hypothetical protein [Blastocatellia bacterium]HMZ16428.1 hypothetical protein [Blastocatellia bacterium]HNG31550.1 hypothetical protein [Blastocatellia bacterium]